MSAPSNYLTLLNAVASAVTSLNLQVGSTVVPVSILMDPAARGSWQNLPLLEVSPIAGRDWRRVFASTWMVPRGVMVALLVAGNQDLVTQLANNLGLRERIMVLLGEPSSYPTYGIDCVSEIDVREDDPFEKSQIPEGFAATGIGLVITCLEDHIAF